MAKDSLTAPRPRLKAVIPAAGRGTRMESITQGAPKELLPIGGRSLLERALEDLSAGGVQEALIVVSRGKPQIAHALGSRCAGVTLNYVEQPSQLGLADALSLAEEFAAQAPLLCWLPDNHWRGARPASAQLLAAHALAPGAAVAALTEHATSALDLQRLGGTGWVEVDAVDSSEDDASIRGWRIARVLPKGSTPNLRAPRQFKGFPLVLWQPILFDRIRELRAAIRSGELDDTPILQQMASAGELRGVVLRDGTLFDCGRPSGYAAACAAAST